MRLFCTLGRVGLTEHWDMILSPAQPYEEHRALIKEAKGSPVHPRYSELQLWSSGGGCEARVKLTGYVENPDPETMAWLPVIPGVVNVPPPPEPSQVPPVVPNPETPQVPEPPDETAESPETATDSPPAETADAPPEAGFDLPPPPSQEPAPAAKPSGRRKQS